MSDLRSKFLDVYQVLISELVNDPAIELIGFSHHWVNNTFNNFYLDYSMLDLHDPRGNVIHQGPSVLESYKVLKDGNEINDDEIFLASALGWCIEWLQAYFLFLDSILEKSNTRPDQNCWFKDFKVRMFAAQDGVILQQRLQRVLKKHFREKMYYADLLDLIQEVEFQTVHGQINNLLTTIEEDKDLSKYSLDLYHRIAHNKRTKYSFYLPVACALLMSGEKLEDHLDAKSILIDIGNHFQFQVDYLNCFGNHHNGKIGTDIEDFKCTWLVVKALELSDEGQKKVLHENYGKQDPNCVAKVKELYNDLNLQGLYADYECQSHERLKKSIEVLNNKAMQVILKLLLAKVYKRVATSL